MADHSEDGSFQFHTSYSFFLYKKNPSPLHAMYHWKVHYKFFSGQEKHICYLTVYTPDNVRTILKHQQTLQNDVGRLLLNVCPLSAAHNSCRQKRGTNACNVPRNWSAPRYLLMLLKHIEYGRNETVAIETVICAKYFRHYVTCETLLRTLQRTQNIA